MSSTEKTLAYYSDGGTGPEFPIVQWYPSSDSKTAILVIEWKGYFVSLDFKLIP